MQKYACDSALQSHEIHAMIMIRKVSMKKNTRVRHALDDAIDGCGVQPDATALDVDQDHSGHAHLAERD